MKKIVFIGLLTASFSTHVCAEESEIKCNLEGNQIELTACADDDYNVADKALNATWKALINDNKGNKSYINKMKASQNLWIKFRDADVAAQFACDEGDARSCWGSMYPMLQLAALTSITEERTKRLQSYIDENQEQALTTPPADCYIHKGPGKDQAVIEINQDNNDITGFFSQVPYEKDGGYGVLKGINLKGLILAEYSYIIEGSMQVEDVKFRSENETLIEGVGELTEDKGKLVFKNPDAIQWGDVYIKTDCKNVDKLISYSREVADDIKKQKEH